MLYISIGGHINPAVSLALAVCDRLPWAKLPFYMLAQFLGSFIACVCVFGVYHGNTFTLVIISINEYHAQYLFD